jgi:molybdopterin-binding protein
VASKAREPAPTSPFGKCRQAVINDRFPSSPSGRAKRATTGSAFTYETVRRRCKNGLESSLVPHYRIAQAASLLGVSDDTVRRWLDSGRLRASSASGPTTIDGAELAAHAQEIATAPELGRPVAESARNRFTGLVTRVIKDAVMAQVDLQCGPFRVVSLMSAEAASELQLEPGVLAVASVKSTHVVVEIPADR